MKWIFLSPHPDDVTISCGGLVWELAHSGDPVSLWTICAGNPPAGQLSAFAQSLQNRWQTGILASRQRRLEDRASCAELGARCRHLPVPDCIYRRDPQDGSPLYASEEALTSPIHPHEVGLVEKLSRCLKQRLPEDARVVCPLSIGGHVDHRLTRAAAEAIQRQLWYYVDYPYVLGAQVTIQELVDSGWQSVSYPVSAAGQAAWERAVSAHRSQISTFWDDFKDIQRALSGYRQEMGGVRLWRPPPAHT